MVPPWRLLKGEQQGLLKEFTAGIYILTVQRPSSPQLESLRLLSTHRVGSDFRAMLVAPAVPEFSAAVESCHCWLGIFAPPWMPWEYMTTFEPVLALPPALLRGGWGA